MKMLTVGCSEGQDATAWHTRIVNPRLRGFLQGNPSYEAIECERAPRLGRSGGGLFTTDGYLAGICNFAEPRGNHGLYATPRSIYALLDRNQLTALYAPVRSGEGTLLADGRSSSPRRGMETPPVARSQSPDRDEQPRVRRAEGDAGLLLPPPRLLGIAEPVSPKAQQLPRAASASTQRVSWHASREEHAQPTELQLDPSADNIPFAAPAAPQQHEQSQNIANREDLNPAPDSRTKVGTSEKSRWREVRPAPANRTVAPSSP
jgi:hypothetical protein